MLEMFDGQPLRLSAEEAASGAHLPVRVGVEHQCVFACDTSQVAITMSKSSSGPSRPRDPITKPFIDKT